MTRVVTYQLAYVPGQVSLCEAHESCDDYGTLGPVSHGQHVGTCRRCEDLASRPLTQDEVAAMVEAADVAPDVVARLLPDRPRACDVREAIREAQRQERLWEVQS